MAEKKKVGYVLLERHGFCYRKGLNRTAAFCIMVAGCFVPLPQNMEIQEETI